MAIKLPSDYNGKTFETTEGLDIVDKEDATDKNDLVTAEAGGNLNTFSPGDRVDLGDGNLDTVSIATDGQGTVLAGGGKVSNTEVLEVTNYTSGNDPQLNVIADQFSGFNTYWLNFTFGGTTNFYNVADDVDVAVYGQTPGGGDTNDNNFYFTPDAYTGSNDTMQVQLKNAYTGLMVESDGGVEQLKVFSKGSNDNYLNLHYVDDLHTLKFAKTGADTEVDNYYNALKKIVVNKNATGDIDVESYVTDYGDGKVKVKGADGDDHFQLWGWYGNDSSEVLLKTKGGDDTAYITNVGDVTANFGGGDNHGEIGNIVGGSFDWGEDHDFVHNALVTAGNGEDDVEVAVEGRAHVDLQGDGNKYVDVIAKGWSFGEDDFLPDLTPGTAIRVDTGAGMDGVWAATDSWGDNVEIATRGGDDWVNITRVEGNADVKTGGNDDVLVTGYRGVWEGDMLNGGKSWDLLVAGNREENGLEVLDDSNFAGVTNFEAIGVRDFFDDGLVDYNAADNGANDAGIAHYIIGEDSGGIHSSYDLEQMADNVMIDLHVRGNWIDDFNVELEDGADDKELNINFFAPNWWGNYSVFEDVAIEGTETLNITLTGEDGGEDNTHTVVFGEDNNTFEDKDDLLTDINLSGDVNYTSTIEASVLDTIDGSDMTANVFLSLRDVADDGIEVTTGSGNDVILGEDADATYDISTGDGADAVFIFDGDGEIQGDDVIRTGDGIDLVYASEGNDDIFTGDGDDQAFFLAWDVNQDDTYEGGDGFDTANIVDGSINDGPGFRDDGFMEFFDSVENLVLDVEDDLLQLTRTSNDNGLVQVDLSAGGEDGLMLSSRFENDLTVLLSEERIDYFGSQGLEMFENTESVYVDGEDSDAEITVEGTAQTFDEFDVFLGGSTDMDAFHVIASNGTAIFGEDTEGFESLTVMRDEGNSVGVIMHDNNVAEDQIFVVDASDLIDDPLGTPYFAGDFFFGGEDETDGAFDVTGGEGEDEIYTGDGDDVVDAGDNDDYVETGAGDDEIDGGDGNDEIFAGDGNDEVDAGDGEDEITGGLSGDDLTGGDGDDEFFYNGLNASTGAIDDGGVDLITDFEGGDDADTGDKINFELFTGSDSWEFIGSYESRSEAENALTSAGDIVFYADENENDGLGNLFVNLVDDGSLGVGDVRITLDGVDSMMATDIILA